MLWGAALVNTIAFQGPQGNSISITAAGSGPTLILLHGFPLDHQLWQDQLTVLSENYQVLAPDFRGFGKSSLSEHPYKLSDLADDVEAVRQHLAPNQPVVLCGLSMGGYVAFEYWRRHAEQLRGLILANTKPESDTDEARSGRLAMAQQAIEGGGWSAVQGMLPKLLAPDHLRDQNQGYQRVLRMMHDCRGESVAAAQQAMAERREFVPALPGIRVPTLVITGAHDVIAPPTLTKKWAAVLPEGRCEVVESAAHLTPLEAPAEFNALVDDFMKRIEGTQ